MGTIIRIPEQFLDAFNALLGQAVDYLTQHDSLDAVLDCEGFEEWFDEMEIEGIDIEEEDED
jgi:hypothetical protein